MIKQIVGLIHSWFDGLIAMVQPQRKENQNEGQANITWFGKETWSVRHFLFESMWAWQNEGVNDSEFFEFPAETESLAMPRASPSVESVPVAQTRQIRWYLNREEEES